ncbi:MAG: DUF4333 domain-containing protein [Acidobacteriota bacterium]
MRKMAIVPLLLMAACTKTLNVDSVKTAISAGLNEKLGVTISSLTCPESREAKAGDSFECTAAVQSGGTLTVTVTQTDANAHIDWKVKNTENLMDLLALETQIVTGLKQQASVDATVSCGGKYRVSITGKTFECTAKTADGKTAPVIITMTDDKGNVNWKVGP